MSAPCRAVLPPPAAEDASDSHVLRPYDVREVLAVCEAAALAGRSERTVRLWCEAYGIGRRVAKGRVAVSLPALQMLLDGDLRALAAYREHGRWHELAWPYFARLGLGDLVVV